MKLSVSMMVFAYPATITFERAFIGYLMAGGQMESVLIAQCENECIPLSVHFMALVQFLGILPWLITLCQPVLSQRGRSHSANPS